MHGGNCVSGKWQRNSVVLGMENVLGKCLLDALRDFLNIQEVE